MVSLSKGSTQGAKDVELSLLYTIERSHLPSGSDVTLFKESIPPKTPGWKGSETCALIPSFYQAILFTSLGFKFQALI